MAQKLGIYIHIPFCKHKCDYCDFYSLAGAEGQASRYQKALLTHIGETAPMARGWEVDTVYFGGGTPLMLGAKPLIQVLDFIKKRFKVSKDAEITVEANPESVDFPTLRALRRAGVNRLSLGMQSACDDELKAVGRIHNYKQVEAAVEAARKAKLKNVSLDLIYGLPNQTVESWEKTLDAAIALNPEHISGYGLKVEEGTPLAKRVRLGETLPDDDAQADAYLAMVDKLGKAGYAQYEISNFAKEGFPSRHNLKYWTLSPYLGFGPGAHSDFGDRRYAFLRDLEGYIAAVENGGRLLSEENVIPQRERGSEYLMLRLRTTHGIEEWEYRREFFMDFDPLLALLTQYERQGWAERSDRRWRFTPEGFLRSNILIAQLLEAQERATFNSSLRALRRREGVRNGNKTPPPGVS